jgi:hypothetical protein
MMTVEQLKYLVKLDELYYKSIYLGELVSKYG